MVKLTSPKLTNISQYYIIEQKNLANRNREDNSNEIFCQTLFEDLLYFELNNYIADIILIII